MLQINTRYERVAKSGDISIVKVDESNLAYHQDLADSGFIYKEIKTIEPSGGVCLSCEG